MEAISPQRSHGDDADSIDDRDFDRLGNNRSESALTSMCRSVALVKLSVTRESTSWRGKCFGKALPEAGTWFLKYI